jgi:O-antigen/teichoic acid export membrane protein
MATVFERLKKIDEDGLIRHGLIVLLFTHMASIANLLFHVVMGRAMSKGEYGILASMLGVILLFATPTLALQNTLAHYSRHLINAGRPGDIFQLLKLWVRRLLFLAIPLAVLVVVIRGSLASFFHIENPTILVITLMTLLITFFLPVFSGVLQGRESFVWMSITANGWGVIRLLLGAYLVYQFTPSALYGLAAHGIGAVISLAIGIMGVWWVVKPRIASGEPIESTDRYFLVSLIPLFSFSVLMNSDAMLVKHYFTAVEDYGNYARASTIGRTMVFLVQPVVVAMFPKVVSRGEWSKAHARTLSRAILYSAIMVLSAVIVCSLFPKIPLWVLFKETAPTAQAIALVRGVCWAMAPLALTFILMNFELAQHRFVCTIPLAICAVLYYTGVALFHETLWQVITVFGVVSCLSMVALVFILFKRPKEEAQAVGNEIGNDL